MLALLSVCMQLQLHFKSRAWDHSAQDKGTGEIKPGPKGIALSVDQWELLKPHLRALKAAAVGGNEGFEIVHLSSDRRAYVNNFK